MGFSSAQPTGKQVLSGVEIRLTAHYFSWVQPPTIGVLKPIKAVYGGFLERLLEAMAALALPLITSLSRLVDAIAQLPQGLRHRRVIVLQLRDFVAAIHHRRVILASEHFTNLGQA